MVEGMHFAHIRRTFTVGSTIQFSGEAPCPRVARLVNKEMILSLLQCKSTAFACGVRDQLEQPEVKNVSRPEIYGPQLWRSRWEKFSMGEQL